MTTLRQIAPEIDSYLFLLNVDPNRPDVLARLRSTTAYLLEDAPFLIEDLGPEQREMYLYLLACRLGLTPDGNGDVVLHSPAIMNTLDLSNSDNG